LLKTRTPFEENKMRHLKQLCAACVLALVLALPAFAGNMEAGITSPQPSSTSSATMQGNMEAGITGEMTTGATAINPATEIILNLLQSLLSLF
jgi:hypothetical protein